MLCCEHGSLRPEQEATGSQWGKGQLVSPSDTDWQVGKGCAAGPGSQNVARPWGPGGRAVLGVLPRLGNLGALEPLPAAAAG